MTERREKPSRARASSQGSRPRRASLAKRLNQPGAPDKGGFRGYIERDFDYRPWNHSVGCPVNLPRPGALRRARSAPASDRHMAVPAAEVDSSWQVAADNAAELEWLKARDELKELTRRSMCAAEAGIRLYSILSRTPSLLSDVLGSTSSTNVEGEAGASRKELLPLPLPKLKFVRESDIVSMFRSPAVLGPKALQTGAESWQHLLVSALNGLDSHGNCVSIFGPPSEAQSRALSDLLADCTQFVADTKARTPTDFGKELGAKANSYWGEPVFCAEELTLAQVLPTLPPKGCLLYTSPSPRDGLLSRMPSSA